MKHLARICAATLLVILPVCLAQATHHKKKPDPKPEPTAPELSAFVRGELLSLSPDARINDNLEVTLDSTSTVLTVTQPDGHCDLFLNALDANTVVWDIFDATDSFQSREKLLRLTVVSVSGKTARTCYDRQSRVDARAATNRARFLFSLTKADQVPDFQAKMAKALKKLIALSGGAPEKDIF